MLHSPLDAPAVAEAWSGWKWIRLGPPCQSRIRAKTALLPICDQNCAAALNTRQASPFGRTRFRECALAFKEAVFRPRQAQIFPQRVAFILRAENPALLQFRHDLVDKVVEAGGQEREHDIKTVAAVAGQPFLHLIGD